MGIAYVNDPALGISVTVIDGRVNADEWRAHAHRQIADPDWPAGPMCLTDASRSEFSPEATAQMEEIAALYVDKADRTRRAQFAIVATKAYMDMVTFQDAADPNGARRIVFTDLASACAWLGVDLDAISALIEGVRTAM